MGELLICSRDIFIKVLPANIDGTFGTPVEGRDGKNNDTKRRPR
jgi:hypothetical protein